MQQVHQTTVLALRRRRRREYLQALFGAALAFGWIIATILASLRLVFFAL